MTAFVFSTSYNVSFGFGPFWRTLTFCLCYRPWTNRVLTFDHVHDIVMLYALQTGFFLSPVLWYRLGPWPTQKWTLNFEVHQRKRKLGSFYIWCASVLVPLGPGRECSVIYLLQFWFIHTSTSFMFYFFSFFSIISLSFFFLRISLFFVVQFTLFWSVK